MGPKKRSANATESDADQWTDVTVQTCTTIHGGRLKKPLVIVTKMFPNVPGTEFVTIRKGESWLVSAAIGPSERQQSLKRTRIVDDIVSAAIAAAHEGHMGGCDGFRARG